MKKISKKSIIIWRLESLSFFVLAFLIIGTLYYFFNEYGIVTKVCTISSVLNIIYLLSSMIRHPLLYRNSNYQMREDSLRIIIGSFTVTDSTIPLKRIQHVDIEQSFFSRLYNMYQLNIYTAGDSHCVGYIPKEDAEKLKEQIVQYLTNMGVEIRE